MKMLHATTLLIVSLATAAVNAQTIIAPLWTELNVDSCLVVQNGQYKNGSPIVLLVYFDCSTVLGN